MATSVLSRATVPSLRAAASQGSSRVKEPTPADVSQSVATVADASGSLHAEQVSEVQAYHVCLVKGFQS